MCDVPALRFPEFTEGWATKSISDLATVIGGGTPDTTVKSYWNGDIQWFTPSEIGKNKYVDLSLRTITEEGLNNSSAKLLPPHTILLSSRATVGECSIALQECATNQGFQSLIAKNCDMDFLYYLIQTKKKELIRKACGSTFLEISANEIRKIHTYVPSINEQKKIGVLLSLIDKRIATQNKIIEKLETLIKGIVVTHHRKCPYKQFVEISKLGKSFSVGVLSKEDLVEDGTPCILYGELFTTYNCVADVIESRTNRTDNQVYSKGDELLFPASTTVDAVSLITPTALIVANVVLGGDMFGIHINKEYNAIYISYILNYVYRQRIAKYAQGCTIIHLHYKDIKNFKLSLPPIEKQEKIVNTLNSMQEKIDCEKQNLRLLNDLRSFLLSKLFI